MDKFPSTTLTSPTDLKCVKCDEPMWFSCTDDKKPGFVRNVYECKKCRSTQTFVTAN